MTIQSRLSHRVIPLALSALVLMAGCATEDAPLVVSGVGNPSTDGSDVAGSIPSTGVTPAPSPTSSNNDPSGNGEASPSPSPTPSATPTTITGGTDTETTPAPIPTIGTGTTPSPAATPVGQLSEPLFVAGTPRAIAFAPNAVYPWVLMSGRAAQLNANGNTIASYTSGLSQPTHLVTTDSRNLWIADAGSGELLHVSEGALETKTLEASYPIGTSTKGLAVDATEAWAVDAGGTLTRITLATKVRQTFAVPSPTAIALFGTDAWVAGLPNKLYRISRATGTTLDTYTVGSEPSAVVVDRNGTVWTANKAGGSLSRLAAGASAPSAPIALGGTPIALAIDAGRVWVALTSPDKAAWFTLGGTLEGSTALPYSPDAMAIDAMGRVWFASPTDGVLFNAWGR